MSIHHTLPPFLRLPSKLRLQIYSHLRLAPGLDEDITTINYTLEWPFLDHPSSTTFTAHQVDRCRCPQKAPRHSNIRTEDHFYTRHLCYGPEVRFVARSQPRWILQQPGIAFNVLRPECEEEREQRPDAGILFVNRLVYSEVCPLLYRDRNFLCITSVCSRGRYQAYATQTWLSQRTAFARDQITSISLICQDNEEDCRRGVVSTAYVRLARFILEFLPRCLSLCLNVWSADIPLRSFAMLFRREGMRIYVKTDVGDDASYVFGDAWLFMKHCGNDEGWAGLYHRKEHVEEEVVSILADSVHMRQ